MKDYLDYFENIDFIEKMILDKPDEMFNYKQLAGSIGGVPVGLAVERSLPIDRNSATANKSYYPTLMSGGKTDIECEWCPEELFDSLFQKVSTKNSKRKTKKARK